MVGLSMYLNYKGLAWLPKLLLAVGPNCTVPASEPGAWEPSQGGQAAAGDELGQAATIFILVVTAAATIICIVLVVCYKRRYGIVGRICRLLWSLTDYSVITENDMNDTYYT